MDTRSGCSIGSRGTRRRSVALLLVLLAGAAAGCEPAHRQAGGDAATPEHILALEIPAELRAGEALYEANCAACHGERALGSVQGPPLVHIVYEPSHHADIAFHFAVERGVRAHHWHFGDMPPVPGLTRAQVDEIVAYVRWLQRQAGIH
jgi:mono/diheme cytochrome c family protein